MKEIKQKMHLPEMTVDDFFTTQEERDLKSKEHIEMININDISDFSNHPFKVTVNEDMLNMSKSIEKYGVLVPVLVRPKGNGKYEMISGHRRKKASELANKETIPCIIRELNDDEATIFMVDSNMQRELILPSERAFSYKLKMDALNHQGKRNDLTLCQDGRKLSTAEIIGKKLGDSERQVFRFIRLTNLIPELLKMVDNDKQNISPSIALSPAVELSFLTISEQKLLLECMESLDCTPSVSQAIKLRKLSEKGNLNLERIESLMGQEKPNQIEKYKFSAVKLRKILPKNLNNEQIEDYVVKAIEFYNKYQRKKIQER